MSILLISSEADDHASAVRQALRSRHGLEAILLDTGRYPVDLRLSLEWERGSGPVAATIVEPSGPALRLDGCAVAWWRRPQPMTLAPELETGVARHFAYTEAFHAISGLWSTLPATWVNDPLADEEAGRKPFQLAVARQVGFEIPKTLITNDPDAVRAFVADVGSEQTIYKAFAGTPEAWRETRILRSEETDLLDAVRYAPVIFQEFVPAVRDIRVTVMGTHVFASEIDSSRGDYHVDYRADLGAADVRSHELPHAVVAHITALQRRLGLVYGAIDLRLTPAGKYVFLEINPSGQWLFMEERTGQPMTDTFADLLAELASRQVDLELDVAA